ncbi:hypothetical protein N7520_004402 [Penicillium odoratum]|uniref:uncharacterized protein n=1 Tax=Penicillium odoratum TaxID=1167516 RepID=UPI0025485B6A|nr:uncharacterized protein N7520_004402 [Penicillium odoratum]KAJ5764843.1 hypothetical protein N7520_004402 [Penicillium odoratum]
MLRYRSVNKPDDQLINQFRTRYGSFLYNACHPHWAKIRGANDAQDSIAPRGFDNASTSLNPADPGTAYMAESINPQAITLQNVSTPGSGAVFHNSGGDLHAAAFRWIQPSPLPLNDGLTPQLSSNGTSGFPASIETRHDLQENKTLGQADHLLMPWLMTGPVPSWESMNPDCLSYPENAFNELPELTFGTDTYATPVSQTATPAAFNMRRECNNFRFHVTLNAPVAMFPLASGNQVTYLNKGHVYNVAVVDSTPQVMQSSPVRYRTHIRVTFEAEEQRKNPHAAWELWKSLRGQKEAGRCNNSALGVEYATLPDASMNGEPDANIQLERTSIDGFSVIWTADTASQVVRCNIPVRFNVLSTDFSRSKGVQGVPVRLCAMTEIVTEEPHEAEMCYGIVKLFRDHGAERKMSNDEAYAKKRVEKISQQMAEKEARKLSRKHSHKRSSQNTALSDKPPTKRRRSNWLNDPSFEYDPNAELSFLTNLLSSERPLTVLGLPGVAQDHPVNFPVQLSDLNTSAGCDLTRRQSDHFQANLMTQKVAKSLSYDGSCLSSPSVQTLRSSSSDTQSSQSTALSSVEGSPVSISSDAPRYVACFYVQFIRDGKPVNNCYHAIYLRERTELELLRGISKNLLIGTDQIRLIWVSPKGMKVIVDDDMVNHFPEGQLLSADISDIDISQNEGRDLDSKVSPIEVRLMFSAC